MYPRLQSQTEKGKELMMRRRNYGIVD
jgi:hypothetical protein